MGSRGPIPKRTGAGHRAPAPIVRLVPGVEVVVPEPPADLLAATRRRWHAFWQSPTSQLVSAGSMPALERLFRIYDEHERVRKLFAKERLVAGSMGQVRMHPLAGHMQALEERALRLEVEFGLTPLAASRLGIAFGEAHRSLDELNRRLAAEHDDDDDDDPTAALLFAGADARRAAAADPRGRAVPMD